MEGINRPESKQQRNDTASLVFKGKLFNVWQRQQKVFTGETKIFEGISRPDTVLIIPILDNGDAVFGREKQPGMHEMVRALGGRIEKGETPQEAAHRELLEETGFTAKELRLWDARQPLNKTDWAIYLFVAHGVHKHQSANLDDGEQIQLFSYPAEKLLDANNDIKFDDNEFLFKLYYAQANKEEGERILKLLSP